MVEEDQIKKLGEMTGADYILVTEVVVVDANNIFLIFFFIIFFSFILIKDRI